MIAISEKLLLVLIYLVILKNKIPETYCLQYSEHNSPCDVNFRCKNPSLVCFYGKCVCPTGFK